MIRVLRISILVALAVLFSTHLHARQRVELKVDAATVQGVVIDNQLFSLTRALATFEVDGKEYTTANSPLNVEFSSQSTGQGVEGLLKFSNLTRQPITLSNILPFGKENTQAFITGYGQHRLSRTHLFLPGKIPVNVIVPDNAWELGYSSLKLNDTLNLLGLARRNAQSLVKATRKRFETLLEPGGSVVYHFYADVYSGSWQTGLQIAFQKRYLFDMPSFDETLFKRTDLAWIRKAYVMHLMMAWDKDFYQDGRFTISEFLKRGKRLYGGDDVICIWPTWPTLGVDQRNQFDLYRDLPGGLSNLRQQADSMRMLGTRFFIAYNPWDESTRAEGHLNGLSYLIKETSADGVVLDTKGESSKALQETADAVKPGVIMYSEGMAVPKDMPEIISGRVHNALYYPPLLNLNKFIRPDFAIFRVAEVFKEPIQREYAVAFFNGYGTEINQFAPGHPEWEEQQYRYLGKTTRILRENTTAFTQNFTPLISCLRDSVWVNQWHDPARSKTIYTILSFNPAGSNGPLFKVAANSNRVIDLWKHEEAIVSKRNEATYAHVSVAGFETRNLGTNNEGEVSCIAVFKKELDFAIAGSKLIGSKLPRVIKIWMGNPAYEKEPLVFQPYQLAELDIAQHFARYEGKLVLQAFDEGELTDEQILYLKPGTPRLISSAVSTSPAKQIPAGMARIPGGSLTIKFTQGDEFIPYPKENEGAVITFKPFAMDKYPVTNAAYKLFMDATGYKPSDAVNFLKHWIDGKIPKGEELHPVIYISYEDAQAYAAWAGKRLPTELEWQYAAQTSAGNEWPWKQTKPVTREETYVTETLTVKQIKGINPQHANLGDGALYPVGKYKSGVNPFGLFDLSGCVWQLTHDVYQSGSYRYIIMKGGSYFKPASSWWYVQGGPRELHYRQVLLRVAAQFERNATVGFRCVKDL
ncbi:MAG: SUMF1/EgtB/PvdO family nonheme iron enzyme [Cyclobacteriaceae bacterium]|nr:SUMF1/EgtB/PvdO family nonheme iron enzyme [Cyclobacteriaceae bacterium]